MAVTITRTTGNADGAVVLIPEADGTNVSIQDLYNAMREFEAKSENMDMRPLCAAEGKAQLATGQVGITLTMLNKACVSFEERAGPALIACNVSGGNITAAITWDGAATSNDVGTTLIDTGGLFAEKAIQTGETIRNVTDGSTATALTVDSETQITHTALTGGTNDDWEIGDVWEIDGKHPFMPTANVHIDYAQDTAPGLADSERILQLLNAILGVSA